MPPRLRSAADLCFDAQQAAEKAVKAVLVLKGRRFAKTHDRAELLALVEDTGVTVPAAVLEAKGLTPYAVAGRYPGISEDATEEDHREALAIAGAVVGWAENLVDVRSTGVD
jgi:HEPN domain-containing protein